MIELIDLKEIRENRSDPGDLRMLLAQLLGQPFRFFRVSYGDELRLHLGDLQAFANPKMRDRKKGAYVIGARASSWIVLSAPRSTLVASEDLRGAHPDAESRAERVDIKEIETGHFITPSSTVTRAGVDPAAHGFTLQLGFSDGSTVQIWPTPDEDDESEVADWEVFTPHGRALSVGPGLRWSYLDSLKKRSD